MLDDMDSPSPSGALMVLAPVDHEWQPILHVSNQVVLYNPTSHALSIRTHSRPASPSLARHARCPYCHRSMTPNGARRHPDDDELDLDSDSEEQNFERASNRAANYFQLLEIANESSGPASPASLAGPNESSSSGPSAFRADNMAEGYFKAFFQEVCRLGMGANGSVYLCQVCSFDALLCVGHTDVVRIQHLLDGNPLGVWQVSSLDEYDTYSLLLYVGYFAVKKVAVGQSHSYLLNTLREVRSCRSSRIYAHLLKVVRTLCAGSPAGEAASPEYHNLPSRMARIISIFFLWPSNTHVTVSSTPLLHGLERH